MRIALFEVQIDTEISLLYSLPKVVYQCKIHNVDLKNVTTIWLCTYFNLQFDCMYTIQITSTFMVLV